MILPTPVATVLLPLAPAFTEPTFERFVLLTLAAVLTTGRRTVANLLRTLGCLAPGHHTSYQRVLSRARWSGLTLAHCLSRLVLVLLPDDHPVVLVGDDTVDGHKGKRVWGKARHRDPVRSTKSYTAWRYGHRWVVLAVLVRFPFAVRPWALPVLIDLYRCEDDNRHARRPHRTPGQLLCRLVTLLLRWFPERRFVLVGDSSYGSHAVARFCHRHHPRLTLVSKLHPEANLFEPPPRYTGRGRPRVKGRALPKPSQVVAGARRLRRLNVGWYGGGQRQVRVKSRTGHWYKAGCGLVPLRWVFVRDQSGTHRDEYFYCTDPSLTPAAIITLYTGRWNIETTFQEVRAHLGLETTRGWCRRTVLRAAPCLLGLYTVVVLLFAVLPEAQCWGSVRWPGKATVTFSDALTAVRRWLWSAWVFRQAGGDRVIQKLPEPVQTLLFTALAPAA